MNPPMLQQRGGFGFAPMTLHYQQDRPNALAWATFALVLLLVLTVGAMLVARLAGRRRRSSLRASAVATARRSPISMQSRCARVTAV